MVGRRRLCHRRADRFARWRFRLSGGERNAWSSSCRRILAVSICSLVISRQVLGAWRRKGRPHRSQWLYHSSSASKAAPPERLCPITRHDALLRTLLTCPSCSLNDVLRDMSTQRSGMAICSPRCFVPCARLEPFRALLLQRRVDLLLECQGCKFLVLRRPPLATGAMR